MELSSILETPASWVLPAINILWFLFISAHGDTNNVETLIRYGATERVRIWKYGESWRLLTSCFLHVGWIHLLMNTYFMFGWCRNVVNRRIVRIQTAWKWIEKEGLVPKGSHANLCTVSPLRKNDRTVRHTPKVKPAKFLKM